MLLQVIVAFLALAAPSDPNSDYIDGVGGPPRVLSPQQVLRFDSMNVKIRAKTGEVAYSAVASNPGGRLTAKLAIPEYGDQLAPATTNFRGFRLLVDGNPVRPVRVLQEGGGRYDVEHSLLWVFSATFAAGQTRRIDVSYASGPGFGTGYAHAVEFMTSAGRGWIGPIRKVSIECDLGGLQNTSNHAFLPVGAMRNADVLRWKLEGVTATSDNDVRFAWLDGFVDIFIDGRRVVPHTRTPNWDRWDNPLGPRPPRREGSQVWLSAKSVAAWCGASMQVLTPDKVVQLSRGGLWVQITVGSKLLRTQKGTIAMPGAARMEEGSIFLWLAPVVEALGGKATFDRDRRVVDVQF